MKALKNPNFSFVWQNNLSFLLFALATFGLLVGFIMPPSEKNDLETYRLKGSVKSVMETKYSLTSKDSSAQKDKILFQKYTLFDRKGYLAQTKVFQNGTEYLNSLYFFGADNKQAKMNEYNSDRRLNVNVIYKYDDKGLRTNADYKWADEPQIGEITDHTDYYFDIIKNDIFTKVQYKYEYRGLCTEENFIKADGSLSFQIASKYDFRGNKLESGYYLGNGKLSWITKYKYDPSDNLTESRVFKSNRMVVLSKYKYQFDATGNWVVRTEDREVFLDMPIDGLDSSNTVTERTIEYY